MKKFFLLTILAIVGVVIISVTRQGPRPVISPQGPKESPLPIEAPPEPGSEPTFEQGVYRDPLLGYSIRVPTGWRAAENYPGVFRSPDEEGLVGYADTKGMVITVNKHPNDAQIPLIDWFSQEDVGRYLVGEPQEIVIAGRPAVQYEADWDVLGHSIGVLIAVDNQIFRIDCFHPRDSSADKERCQTTLSTVLETLQFDPQK